MASELKVNTLTGVSTAGSIAVTGEGNSTTTNLQQGLSKAWIHYDGVNSDVTRDSFNMSVTTDHAAGQYTFTYTNSFGNAYPCPTVSCGTFQVHTELDDVSATTVKVQSRDSANSNAQRDTTFTCITTDGDLA